jgi:hypothetical protein
MHCYVTHLTEELDQLFALQVVHTFHDTWQQKAAPQVQIPSEICCNIQDTRLCNDESIVRTPYSCTQRCKTYFYMLKLTNGYPRERNYGAFVILIKTLLFLQTSERCQLSNEPRTPPVGTSVRPQFLLHYRIIQTDLLKNDTLNCYSYDVTVTAGEARSV